MKFSISREQLLPPLQLVAGIVEKKQTLPMLANILFIVEQQQLSLLASDLEVELIAKLAFASPLAAAKVAIPTRKVVDICRALPEDSIIDFSVENQKVIIKSGRSRYVLTAFEAAEFPYVDIETTLAKVSIAQKNFRYLLEKTHFAMAQQDVRYYLNGLLLEANKSFIRAVTTDGHRLAISTLQHEQEIAPFQIIIPRKAILELLRLLDAQSEQQIDLIICNNYFRIVTEQYIFTTRLIEGQFPAFEKVIPKNNDKEVVVNKDEFKKALNRAAILANAKLRGICLHLKQDLIRITAHNAEQELAEEEVMAQYAGPELEIGLNVSYLLDVLQTIPSSDLHLYLHDANSSVLIEESTSANNLYIIMPMRV